MNKNEKVITNAEALEEIRSLIERDPQVMRALRAIRALGLKNWGVGGGAVRSIIWDHFQEAQSRTPISDIDVTFFDQDLPLEKDKEYETQLEEQLPELEWEVVNQVYAHPFNNHSPYSSLEDAVAHWPETANAIAIRLEDDNKLTIIAPYGVDDLVKGILRPTPPFREGDKLEHFKERLAGKDWLIKWPNLKVEQE